MELHCIFSSKGSKCVVNKLTFTSSKSIRILGDRGPNQTNEIVTTLEVCDMNIGKFPRGIGSCFPNLRYLYVENCGIKQISRDDFTDLEKLNELNLSYNQIHELSADVFSSFFYTGVYDDGLKRLLLNGNGLKFIHRKAFEGLNSVTLIELGNNDCIDKVYSFTFDTTLSVFQALMLQEIAAKCKPPPLADEKKDNSQSKPDQCIEEVWSGRISILSIFVLMLCILQAVYMNFMYNK